MGIFGNWKGSRIMDNLLPLPKGAVAVNTGVPLPQGAVPVNETAYDRFINSIQLPKMDGNRVVGPMLAAGTGELIKGACLPLPLKSYHVEPVPAYDDELFASR